jgi:hypothetical protein
LFVQRQPLRKVTVVDTGVAAFTVVDMEAADTTAVDITGDITVAGTMVDTTAVLGRRSGGRTMALRSTTVPTPRTTGIRIMVGIHQIMVIHQQQHTEMLRHHPHLQPNVTLQWLTKMEG